MWPERRSSMSKNSVRKAINTCQEETPELDAAREERGTPLPDDDPDYEEIMNSATRKLETRTASAMPCKVTKTSQPERFKAGSDPAQMIGLKLKRKDGHVLVQSLVMRT